MGSAAKGNDMCIGRGRTLAAVTMAGLLLGAIDGTPGGASGSSSTSAGLKQTGSQPVGARKGHVTFGGAAAAHAYAAIAGTVGGIMAAQEARRAYRRDLNRYYVAPYPAPYYPYPHGYPYW
jgi:hypothetical protein